MVSAPGRKRRLEGTGSALSTVAVLPILRSARASASSEPIASPSGFSWQAIRKRSWSRNARPIASTSLFIVAAPLAFRLLPVRLLLRDHVEQVVDAGDPGEPVVVEEGQLWG